nr:MAG TPA: hypothetical protein [Caudoviricetes sp.]
MTTWHKPWPPPSPTTNRGRARYCSRRISNAC